MRVAPDQLDSTCCQSHPIVGIDLKHGLGQIDWRTRLAFLIAMLACSAHFLSSTVQLTTPSATVGATRHTIDSSRVDICAQYAAAAPTAKNVVVSL